MIGIRSVCQKRLFFVNKAHVSRHEAFFGFKIFLPTKVGQNTFEFSQIESYSYSIFYCDTLIQKSICVAQRKDRAETACLMLFLLLLLLIPNIIHSAVSLLSLKFFARLAVVIHKSNSPTLLCFCVANTHYLNHVSTLIVLFGRCKNYPVKICVSTRVPRLL